MRFIFLFIFLQRITLVFASAFKLKKELEDLQEFLVKKDLCIYVDYCHISCWWNVLCLCQFIRSWLTTLSSPPCLHLWRAADKDCASKCLMNKACVMERQTLCVREVLCLLSFQGLSITRHTRTQSRSKVITSKQEMTHIERMSARTASHPVWLW